MKKISAFLIIFYFVVTFNSGCDKEPNQVKNLQSGCRAKLFSVPSWYTDSISWSGDKISSVVRSYRKNTNKNTRALFEYSGSSVKISVSDFLKGYWSESVTYDLSFTGSGISTIVTNSGRANADYFYSGSRLGYILYHQQDALTDSIAVEYDAKGENIASAQWFRYDSETRNYNLAGQVDYSYDTRNNPYCGSIHFLYNFYDCKEYSLDYFNKNNIKTIQSGEGDIHTEYTYNEFNYPTYVTFYDAGSQVTDCNFMEYDCN